MHATPFFSVNFQRFPQVISTTHFGFKIATIASNFKVIHFISQTMGAIWTYFMYGVASPIIYKPCKFRCSKSTVKSMFDDVIAMICFGNSHIDEKVEINTFYINNWFIKWIYLNLESLFALIITVFMILLYFFIRLNESFI